jgi:DNA protecting protein DprA
MASLSQSQPRRSLAVDDAANVSEQLAFLALASIRGVGYWTLYKMARSGVRFSNFMELEDGAEATAQLKDFGARLDNKSDWRSVRPRSLERAAKLSLELKHLNVKFLRAGSEHFPASLSDLTEPPEWLFVQGSTDILSRPSISAVGTREPSADGLWLASFVGASLGLWKAPTVSGLAAGIDQIVHNWSLRANVPTIAVLGTGIFSEYPKGAADLREKILDAGGAIISEYLPRESYSGENFVRRNRLQAALGRILIPVEWATKSGTAHTVRYASQLKRPLACLRLADWDSARVVLPSASGDDSSIFTIPGQETEFRNFVEAALSRSSDTLRPVQPDLFA